jgi:hypothetical protein
MMLLYRDSLSDDIAVYRYSDFDALDEVLNTKYGLPPAGLPPKKWFVVGRINVSSYSV